MATLTSPLKLIASAPGAPLATDTLIGVGGGATDYQYTVAQLSQSIVPHGPTGAIQFNNSGVLGGTSGFIYDGANSLTINQGGGSNFPGAVFNVTTNANPNLAIWSGYSTVSGGNNPTYYQFSANNAIGSQGLLPQGTVIASWRFQGSDGIAFREAARIAVACDVAPAANSMPGAIFFYTTPSGSTTPQERFRIDNQGLMTTGGTSPAGLFGLASFFTASSFGGGIWAYTVYDFSSGPNAGGILFAKSRGTTLGSQVAVQLNDRLCDFATAGSDGTALAESCSFHVYVDGAVAAGSIPSRFILGTTAVGNAGPAERLRIDSGGTFTFNSDPNHVFIPGVGQFQIVGTTSNSIIVQQYNVTGGQNIFAFQYSRNATAGTQGLVNSGDVLFNMRAQGSDGTAFRTGASIVIAVDGTAAANSMPGVIALNTTPSGSTSASERIRINNQGSLMMSASALATSATDGFFYVNACAGAPTGVPTAPPGGAKAMVYDTTNNKLWVYNGSWRGVVLT